MNLNIPSDRRLAIIQNFKDMFTEVGLPQKKRNIVRFAAKYVAGRLPQDLDVYIEGCITIAKDQKVANIFEFWDAVVSQFERTYRTEYDFNFRSREFSLPVGSALTQSLFTQFENHKLSECVQRLITAVPNHTCVDWSKVDTAKFCERLKTNWVACISLMVGRSYEDHCKDIALMKSVGISLEEFIKVFLTPNKIQELEENKDINRNIWNIIASHCDGQGLITFRQLCKKTYNIVESGHLLRHRRSFLAKCKKLQNVIGKELFWGNGLWITDPRDTSCQGLRVTQVNPAISTTILHASHLDLTGQLLACHALKNDDGSTYIVTAFIPKYEIKGIYLDISRLTDHSMQHKRRKLLYPNNEQHKFDHCEATLAVKDQMVTVNLKLYQRCMQPYSATIPLTDLVDEAFEIEMKKC